MADYTGSGETVEGVDSPKLVMDDLFDQNGREISRLEEQLKPILATQMTEKAKSETHQTILIRQLEGVRDHLQDLNRRVRL